MERRSQSLSLGVSDACEQPVVTLHASLVDMILTNKTHSVMIHLECTLVQAIRTSSNQDGQQNIGQSLKTCCMKG